MDTLNLLKALAEPVRYGIFMNLLERKHCVRSLSRKMGVSEPAVSQHLKLMREAGLVYGERYGKHIHYLPRQEAVDMLAEAMDGMRKKSLRLDRGPSVCQCEFRGSGTK